MIDLDPAGFTKYQSLRTGRMEKWGAKSKDGKWSFRRIEDVGTPWEVTHEDFPGWSMLAGSLPKARKYAEAQLAADLDALARGVT